MRSLSATSSTTPGAPPSRNTLALRSADSAIRAFQNSTPVSLGTRKPRRRRAHTTPAPSAKRTVAARVESTSSGSFNEAITFSVLIAIPEPARTDPSGRKTAASRWRMSGYGSTDSAPSRMDGRVAFASFEIAGVCATTLLLPCIPDERSPRIGDHGRAPHCQRDPYERCGHAGIENVSGHRGDGDEESAQEHDHCRKRVEAG